MEPETKRSYDTNITKLNRWIRKYSYFVVVHIQERTFTSLLRNDTHTQVGQIWHLGGRGGQKYADIHSIDKVLEIMLR